MLEVEKNVARSRSLFGKSEDLPQVIALLSASLSGFGGGALFAFSSPAIPKLISDYHFTIEEASYFAVVPSIAMAIAAPFFSVLADQVGRKYTLLSVGVLHIISWLLVSFAKSIYVFYVSRIFFGIADACIFSTLPVYVGEVTTPKVRTLYGSIMVVFIYMGQFFANFIGFYYSISDTGFIMLVFPILLLTTFSFMPETPYYLIMKDNIDGARKSLRRLRNFEDVEDELKQLILDVNRQLSEPGRFKDLWLIESNRKALVIANLARLFQQYSGFVSIIVYCQYIFQEAGTDVSSGVASMIVSGMLALVNIFGNVVCDKLGRRKSMIISFFGCGASLFCEATYFHLQTNEIVDLSAVNWFPVFGLVMYVIIYALGIGVVPTVMLGEIFSTSIRRHATAVTNVMFGVHVCVATKVFQLMMSAFGLDAPFFFSSACCFVACVVSFFAMPETKGKTLEEIQQMLKGK